MPAREPWLLDPDVTYLTHGTFGSCPRPVLEYQAALREEMERHPIVFLDYELERRLDEARQPLAALINADPADLTFITNATAGVNTVLQSLDLRPGDEILTTDHEYNACLNTVREVCSRAGATAVVARVPLPVSSADQIVDAIVGRATPSTRLAMVSHVTSPTAVVFPVARIAEALAQRGIATLIDGAHAPGMVPVDVTVLSDLGVGYYTGNCHKWLCAPKGAGFLWVRRDRQTSIRPLVISHAANSARTDRSLFLRQADWTGTLDPTPFLAVPKSMEFLAGLHPGGWPALMAANHELLLRAREVVRGAAGTAPLAPDDLLGAMAAIELPSSLEPRAPRPPPHAPSESTLPEDPLRDVLYERFRIEVPVFTWPPVTQPGRPGLRLTRISAQSYNVLADYEELAQALTDLQAGSAGGA